MIKVNRFTNPRSILKLEQLLDKRRVIQNTNISVVSKILKNIKKNKNKALIKYEKKFSKNSHIKPTTREINRAIRSLNPKIKKAIDYAYNRIFKYHSLQKVKNINYRDKLKNGKMTLFNPLIEEELHKTEYKLHLLKEQELCNLFSQDKISASLSQMTSCS